jgi:molybdate transport system substrate-binding protein
MSRRPPVLQALLTLCALCVTLSACSPAPTSAAPQPTVRVLAASSLTGAFQTLAKRFEALHPGSRVSVSFGASSTLVRQVVEGAPADVLATASQSTMDTVTRAGLAAHPATIFALNRLQIAVPAGNPAHVTGLADFGNPRLRTVLCAKVVPCGSTALAALAEVGVTPHPASYAIDVKAALSTVASGEADAALVYRTDVLAAGKKVEGIDLPHEVSADTRYPITVIRPGTQAAQEFVDLVLSSDGMKTLRSAGFEAP